MPTATSFKEEACWEIHVLQGPLDSGPLARIGEIGGIEDLKNDCVVLLELLKSILVAFLARWSSQVLELLLLRPTVART